MKKAVTAGTGSGKAGKKVQFFQKPSCTTCRKARAFLEKRGFALQFRDLDKARLSATELDKLIGNRDHKEFLNTRNALYRQKKMKQNPPSRREAISMMAKEPNLIRRPLILAGGRLILGFDAQVMADL